jgi:DNA-binding winged helix-turn-helix (wHTH) protein/TolB-like protein/cytochrome c-type biogenesis protein CcmH/NrfG
MDGACRQDQKSSTEGSENLRKNLNLFMPNARGELYEFAEFRLNAERLRLLRAGEPVPLPPKAIELLLLLVERQGQIVEKDFLMTALWSNVVVEESNLTQNIYLLRKALGKTADGQSFIETHSKRGYRFVPAVTLNSHDSEPLVVARVTRTRVVVEQEENETAEPEEHLEEITPLPPSATLLLPAKTYNRPILRRPLAVVAVFALLVMIGLIWVNYSKSADASPQSLAVLPFKTIGPPGHEAFLGLGMADAVIIRLGKTGKLLVSPTAAVRRYHEKEADPISAGKSLGVATVLSGNVQQNGDRLRVTVQLLRVGDGQQIWADQFDEKLTDVFAVQDLLAQRLATALTLRLTEVERERLKQPHTPNLEAYQLYLRGRYYWNRRTPEWIRKGIECFEQAVKLDPAYAQAYAGLADSYAISASGLPPLERLPKAKAAAERALELDDTLAEAHTSLGFIRYKFDWDWAGAERSFKRAMELNPNYATAFHWYGEMLGLLGRFDEAITILQQAERLDPLSIGIKHNLGETWFRARQYERTEQVARELLDFDPTAPHPHYLLWHVAQVQGRYDDAVAERIQQLIKSNTPPEVLTELQQARATGGWRAYWQKELELAAVGKLNLNSNERAKHCLYLGDKQQALQWIEMSFAERGDVPVVMKTLPSYDSLRGDAHFAELLQRAGHTP